MDKEGLYEIVGLRKEGLSQREIAKRFGFSKGYVSACLKVYDTLIGDVEKKRRDLEEEREMMEEMRKEHEKKSEETKRLRREVSELREAGKEEEAGRKRVKREAEEEERRANLLKRGRKEYGKYVKELYEEYIERDALEREKDKLGAKIALYQTDLKELKKRKKEEEEVYRKLREGEEGEFLAFFRSLSVREKMKMIMCLPRKELSEIFENLEKMAFLKAGLRSR